MATILCVDDDTYLIDLLRYGLTREGFDMVSIHTGREALRLLQRQGNRIDLVILETTLPDMDGLHMLATLRTFSQAPVVVATARSRPEDIIAGFESGADDYVVKPFSMDVLVNRVKAVLRRTPTRSAPTRASAQHYRIGSAIFAAGTDDVVSPTMTIHLTPTESRVLRLLFAHEGQALPTEHILEHIRGHNSSGNIGVVKTYIRNLREKIGRLPGSPQPIRTLPGLGYVAYQTDENGDALPSEGSAQ